MCGITSQLYDKYVFNANHDAYVTIFLYEVNSRTKVPSHKTININKPVEQISVAKKPERQISTRLRFSIKKTSTVHEKTTLLDLVLAKVDCEPPHDSNADITNPHECKQTLNVSASTLNVSASTLNFKAGSRCSDTSLQELKLLFNPMYEEYFNKGTHDVFKSFALSDNLQQLDTPPTLNVQPTLEPITPTTNVIVEENNNDQAEDA
ncbi:hypothetical protein Tco_0538723 [Tanacetum coccineum]